MSELLIFGAGYSAMAVARACRGRYETLSGTTRSPDKASSLGKAGIEPLIFDGGGNGAGDALVSSILRAAHILVSIAPDDAGDPVLRACGRELSASRSLKWLCYFSTVGVYGDHGGDWVDETSECRPVSRRSKNRLAAEGAWREFAAARGVPLAILRLSGIYGPGRNAFVNIERGTSRRLDKPGQVFNRIHRDDIATAFLRAAEREADGIFNITDDRPAPPQDVVARAHALRGTEAPPLIPFAGAELTAMARSFYGENKRVSNRKSKALLGMAYAWPDYETALERMWREGSWRAD